MSAAWTRKEGKNPEGGLNAKGRASYHAKTGGTLRDAFPEACHRVADSEIVRRTRPLIERYKRGEASFHVHYLDGVAKNDVESLGEWCAVVNCIGAPGNSVLGPDGRVFDASLNGADMQNQGTMLVGITEFLQNGEPVRIAPFPSRVRLQRLDCCKDRWPFDALYLSLVTSEVVWLDGMKPEDRKLGFVGEGASISQNQGAGEVIKRRPELVQSVAGEDAQSRRDDAVLVEVLERFSGLRIVVDEFSVRCFMLERGRFQFELLDMLIGPL